MGHIELNRTFGSPSMNAS
ncbi:hypothetical protein LINPERHAP1_LOCUS22279 [Linum perenne]